MEERGGDPVSRYQPDAPLREIDGRGVATIHQRITRGRDHSFQVKVRVATTSNSSAGMNVRSQTFEKTRVLVALALLLSAGAPLVQYACGVTGETHTASTLAVEAPGSNAAPCGVLSEGVHDRLCGASSDSVCEGEGCTTDTVEKQSVVQFPASSLWIDSILTAGERPSDRGATRGPLPSSGSAPGADETPLMSSRIPVRLRTQSCLL